MFQAPFETPYVVKLHNMNVLDTAQPLFHFHHPNRVKGQWTFSSPQGIYATICFSTMD